MSEVPPPMMEASRLRSVRIWLIVFIIGLVLSGITAFPLESELRWLAALVGSGESGLSRWIHDVRDGLIDVNARYPYMGYGTDWLAFSHLLIAALFIGPVIDPVKNLWVIRFGVFACLAVIPMAMIAGHMRGIPMGWRLLDCGFGVLGLVPLLLALRCMTRRRSTPPATV